MAPGGSVVITNRSSTQPVKRLHPAARPPSQSTTRPRIRLHIPVCDLRIKANRFQEHPLIAQISQIPRTEEERGSEGESFEQCDYAVSSTEICGICAICG